jgi:hypothetical protein
VGIKRCLDFVLRIGLRDFAGFELGITAFAYADSRERGLYDSEFTFLHLPSLPVPVPTPESFARFRLNGGSATRQTFGSKQNAPDS